LVSRSGENALSHPQDGEIYQLFAPVSPWREFCNLLFSVHFRNLFKPDSMVTWEWFPVIMPVLEYLGPEFRLGKPYTSPPAVDDRIGSIGADPVLLAPRE